VALDQFHLSLKDVALPSKLRVPGISATGLKEWQHVEELEVNNISSTTVIYRMWLKKDQCALLKYKVTAARLNNLKFTILRAFTHESGIERYSVINGVMNISKVVQSDVQPVF